MRQKVFIFIGLIFLAVLLVGLNAASYVEKEKTPDNEFNPNRSTYNAGATGTRALYELLAETGKRVVRWQEPPSALPVIFNNKNNPSTFVVVGATRREFTDKEVEQLLHWVSAGGRLVVIDRRPPEDLIATTANWKISIAEYKPAPVDVDPTESFGFDGSNPQQMIGKTAAVKPVQPGGFTEKINAVQPSRLAAGIVFERLSDESAAKKNSKVKGISAAPSFPPRGELISTTQPAANSNQNYGAVNKSVSSSIPPRAAASPIPNGARSGQGSGTGSSSVPPPPPPAMTTDDDEEEFNESSASGAPIVYLAGEGKNLLVDFPFGAGEIVLLSDPFVVSNGGISFVDNAQIAVNILSARGNGTIAFDEYHQGFGAGNNRLLQYFAGTPVAAIFAQALILIGLIFFAQSRRFARALPEVEPNRLSKLEYVSAMAQLQQRTKAYDLAIENIYTDFRRRASRLLGADNYTVSLEDLARLIGERTGENRREIENPMRQCEEIIRGEPTSKKEVLQLTSRLREIEGKLGMWRRKRSNDAV